MDILLVAPILPWPPNRAEKIRAWHLLEHLTARHRVHLGAFVDDSADWAHAGRIERRCASVCLRPLGTARQLARLPAAMIAGRPLSTGLYGDAVMRRWVSHRLAAGVDASMALSAAGATLLIDRPDARPAILDLVECASESWARRAEEAPWPWRWMVRREHRLVRTFERAAAWYFDRTILVSADEATALARIAPESASRLTTIGNGVDTAYFDPATDLPDPYPADGRRVVVLTGAMDEAANVEAARWMARTVMPRLRAAGLPVRFAVVGDRPVAAVRRLGAADDVTISGRVDDVRPWLRHATVAVAPLRLGRGVPSKVLEAMAMGLAVVATPSAARGVDAEPGLHLVLAEGVDRWSEALDGLLRAPECAQRLGAAARARVVERLGWPERLSGLDALLRQLAEGDGHPLDIQKAWQHRGH